MPPLPAFGDPHQGRLRRRQRGRRPDVRRRGARRRGGPPGPAVRRPRRGAAQRAARPESGWRGATSSSRTSLKCRPPGNRDPQPHEIETCRPYLREQIRLIEPRVICTLGNFSTKLLTGSQTGITRVRGTPQVHSSAGGPCSCCRCSTRRPRCARPPWRRRCEADFATIPTCSSGRCPRSRPSRRGGRRAEEEPRPAPQASQLGLLRLSAAPGDPGRGRRTGSAAETEAVGAEIAARLGPGDVVLVERRDRLRQDDADPRRLPGARGRGPGHLADLHDRPPLPRAGAGFPPRPLPARAASRARTRRCSRTT